MPYALPSLIHCLLDGTCLYKGLFVDAIFFVVSIISHFYYLHDILSLPWNFPPHLLLISFNSVTSSKTLMEVFN